MIEEKSEPQEIQPKKIIYSNKERRYRSKWTV